MKADLVQVDTFSSVMNAAGDKMVTNGKGIQNPCSRKGGKAGPAATVKFGSASVPIYLSESKGRKRYFIAHYRDGKRITPMPACQPDHTAGHLRSGQPWDLKRALASTKQPHWAHVRFDLSWSHDPHAASRDAT